VAARTDRPARDATTEVVERVLKRDVLGRVELVRLGAGLAVRRVPTRVPIVAAIARLLQARERRALRVLAGLPGVTQLLDHRSSLRSAQLRSWLPGQPLALADPLPRDFFERLEELVRSVHTRGVCHNDLHKEGNILVGDDGRPALIDFQLASVHGRRGRSFRVRAAEDLRHVGKHRSIYCRRMGVDVPDDGRVARASTAARLWRRLVKPVYNGLTRKTGLRARFDSGEPRRRSDGSWPSWTDPVGPRRDPTRTDRHAE
jgi:Phosphotransferase enzyme family